MNRIILLIFSCIIAFGASAQLTNERFGKSKISNDLTELIGDTKIYPCTDPEFDWQQYDEKTGKALVTKNGLELESKKDDVYCMSFCELPIDMRGDDFSVKYLILPDKISDDKPFGVVYDVESDSNYRMLLIMKKSFQLINVSDGKMSVVKKGIYKTPNKFGVIFLEMSRKKDKLRFYINGLEMLKIKSPEMSNPNFGFIVAPKTRICGLAIGFDKSAPDLDEEGDI